MTLEQWMKTKGMRDADLANRIEGLSRSQINRIRRGDSLPTLETARKLEAVTKIPAVKFLTGEAATRKDAA